MARNEITDTFEAIAKQLEKTPEVIQQTYDDVTKKVMDKYFDKMVIQLDKTSGSSTLNSKKTDYPPYYVPGKVYIRQLDWSNERPYVNEALGKGWGSEWGRKKKRAAGKRNFSLRPATFHDLAYIINYGHDGISGTYFITTAWHNFIHWKGVRNTAFKKELNKLKRR